MLLIVSHGGTPIDNISKDFTGYAVGDPLPPEDVVFSINGGETYLYPSSLHKNYFSIKKLIEEDKELNIMERKECFEDKTNYIISCEDETNLDQNHVLKTISSMKAKLFMMCLPIHVEYIECKMTSQVKQNIIIAYKKLHMYGKKLPFIARFDEYGKRLSDEVKIETLKGMNIQIVDSEDYGDFYLEFKGIVANLDLPF